MELGRLGPEHRAQLATFECATSGAEYSLVVEQQIRRFVADELESGQVQGIGSWDGFDLAALVVFAPHAPLWRVTVLATGVRFRERKQALRLKRELMRQARDAGATAIVSRVHRDNGPMLALNKKLGGVVDEPPDRDDPYLVCTVPVG